MFRVGRSFLSPRLIEVIRVRPDVLDEPECDVVDVGAEQVHVQVQLSGSIDVVLHPAFATAIRRHVLDRRARAGGPDQRDRARQAGVDADVQDAVHIALLNASETKPVSVEQARGAIDPSLQPPPLTSSAVLLLLLHIPWHTLAHPVAHAMAYPVALMPAAPGGCSW